MSDLVNIVTTFCVCMFILCSFPSRSLAISGQQLYEAVHVCRLFQILELYVIALFIRVHTSNTGVSMRGCGVALI